MQVLKDGTDRPIKAWLDSKPDGSLNLEEGALQQAKNLAKLPFIAANGVALMPDAHFGIGSSVGTVIATDRAIIPATVGVDIGCGMNAVRLSLKASDLPDSLLEIRHQIERDIPVGNAKHKHPAEMMLGDRATALKTSCDALIRASKGVAAWDDFTIKAHEQLGTLGGGNHFIELCVDESDDVWVMLHSGSRGVGNMIGRHYIEKAKREMEKYFITLPHDDLAYFPEGTENFNDYKMAVNWAQDYALANRAKMMELVLAALDRRVGKPFTVTTEAINCHHNYVELENHFGRNLWITRKGAIRARTGDLGIIPGSMGQRSYIVRGKGQPESYCSCSHGAGRVMSRTEAKKKFSLRDLVDQTEGVECRKDADVIDEIPGAYKDLDLVMANQADLVEVVHTLKAVLCVKGN